MYEQIIYHHINVTNKEKEKEYFENLEKEGFILIGIEITDIELSSKCHIIIDPQHDGNNTNMTSIEYIFQYNNQFIDLLKSSNKLCMITIKPDMDSISSMAVLTLLLYNDLIYTGELILRLKAIAKSDRHGRTNWKNRKEDYFHFENYNSQGLPSGLAYMTSDYKIDIKTKVNNMIQYLKTGNFPTLNKYNQNVNKNLEKSINLTELDIIIPKKLAFVESNFRGAVAYGYKFCPVVIAKNNNFAFGIGNTKKYGKKITIAQYEDNKYINLNKLVLELKNIEPGWGGSSVIIGSPQETPCLIKDEIIIYLTKKYLYNI